MTVGRRDIGSPHDHPPEPAVSGRPDDFGRRGDPIIRLRAVHTRMQVTLPVALGAVLAVVVLGVAGLIASGMMAIRTTLMMVAPSMLVFGLLAFGIGVKHGEFRATR